MKQTLRLLPFLVAAFCAATLHPAAQATTTLHADLLKDWTGMKDRMVKIADAMPEEKFGFKPTPAQRSYGEQILHVAGANVTFMKMLGGKATPPTIDQKATSKAAILKAIADSYDYGTAVLNEQTDQSLLEAIQGPRFLGPSTRARLVWFTLGHAWDEYGNMTTYLRLNGIVPPASRNAM